MANRGDTRFQRTFFGDTPDDPPFFIGDRMVIHEFKSLNYVAGSTGWRISNEGDVEFNDATFRGTLQSDNFVAGTSGWRLLDTGGAEFSEVTVRGSSVLAGASITGDLTMTGSGKIKTAASGRRMEIATATTSKISVYTGDADEDAPAYIDFAAVGDLLTMELRSPDVNGEYARLYLGANQAVASSQADMYADIITLNGSAATATFGIGNALITAPEVELQGSGTNIVEFWSATGPTLKGYVDKTTGRMVASSDANGAAIMGSWSTDGRWAIFGNASRVAASGDTGYALLCGGTSGDANTYLNCPTGGQIFFERGGDSTTGVNVCGNLASVAGPDPTIHISNSAPYQWLRNSSSQQFKRDIVPTPGDEDPHDNPIWSVQPVRYRWREGAITDAERVNAIYPDGIHGFIAEDLGTVAKDLVTWDADGNAQTPNDWAILAYTVRGLQHCHAGLKRRVAAEEDLALRLSRIEALPSIAALLKGKK